MPVNLCWTCDVAGKNGQKHIPVDCFVGNKSVTGLKISKNPVSIVELLL